MFDVTNKKSFENAQQWKNELDAKVELPNGQSIPCVLIGNKVCGSPQTTLFACQNNDICMYIFTYVYVYCGVLFVLKNLLVNW